MNKGRRIGALVTASVAAIGMTMTVTGGPASAATKAKGPQPINQILQPVDEGKATWVSVWFRTDKRACDFKLTLADLERVDIRYPSNTPGYSSLYRNDNLKKDEVDYASFRVKADGYRRDKVQPLFAKITWKWCGTKKVQTRHTGFLLPVHAD